jgi:hypothetical protein
VHSGKWESANLADARPWAQRRCRAVFPLSCSSHSWIPLPCSFSPSLLVNASIYLSIYLPVCLSYYLTGSIISLSACYFTAYRECKHFHFYRTSDRYGGVRIARCEYVMSVSVRMRVSLKFLDRNRAAWSPSHESERPLPSLWSVFSRPAWCLLFTWFCRRDGVPFTPLRSSRFLCVRRIIVRWADLSLSLSFSLALSLSLSLYLSIYPSLSLVRWRASECEL